MIRLVLLCTVCFFSYGAYSQIGNSDSTQNGRYFQYKNQTILTKGYFKNQKRHKLWTWYQTDGSMTKQIRYNNGKPVWILYFDKNKPWLKINRFGKRRIIRACECREGA